LTPASDVFSLGATMYRQLTGRWPFRGRFVGDVFEAIRSQPVEPLRLHAPALPRRLDAIVRRALAKDPAARPSMLELGRALDRFLRRRALLARLRPGRRRPGVRPNRIHPETST
jgi:serine/threonine protein kinase